MITDREIGWLAGILEGEGFFGFNGRGRTPTLQVSMTDEDVILKLAALIEKVIGKPINVYTNDRFTRLNEKWQIQFKIQINGDQARMVMLLVIGEMGYRRRQRMWQVLNGYKPKMTEMKSADLLQLVVNK